MKRGGLVSGLLVAGMVPVLAGCYLGSRVWVEELTQMTIPAQSIERLAVRTHNGRIDLAGMADASEMEVTITRKAGGRDRDSAQRCLKAIEIVSESSAGAGHQLGWRWKTPKADDWEAHVSFDVHMPARVAADARTHNGSIIASKLASACELRTHNGNVEADVLAAPLTIQTHNGDVTASTAGERVDLSAHNGRIDLDATRCPVLGGSVRSHNGGIRIRLGEATATQAACSTHNGRLSHSTDFAIRQESKHSVQLAHGTDGPELAVQTHNGRIQFEE